MANRQSTRADRYVGSQIRAARREIGMSQTALGDLLDVSFQQVQKYENGANRISAGSLFEIAERLDKPVQWFFPPQRKR